jgi:uncharacterized protein YqiB (DUF1249 family)
VLTTEIVKVVFILSFCGMWSYIANFVNLSQDAAIAEVTNAHQDLRW